MGGCGCYLCVGGAVDGGGVPGVDVVEACGGYCAEFEYPDFFCSFSLCCCPVVLRFQSGDDEVVRRVSLKVGYQSCGEFTCPDVVKMLAESGEEGVFRFSNVMFMTNCASDDVNQIAGAEGE